MRKKSVQAINPRAGIRVAGPPMLRPTEIDRVLSAARRSMPVAPLQRTIVRPAPAAARAPAGTRRAQSLPSNPNAPGTGVNPWWTYNEHGVPGGGHAMVNVGTGNLVVQQDDMAVLHKA
ncbi:MAG: hypothetical protein QOD51_268, partial [Candidatus Eremiobacteraeota bacterium]|nr:hypothetical protein [Candidatus Eremiobacteraeota bacterium]